MTLTDLEKFYQLGNIEGLAFIDNAGVLIEDQTVISSEAAQIVAQSFAAVHQGLRDAQRPCNGFLARFSRHQFLSIDVADGIVILQLNPGQPVDDCFKQVVSMARHSQGSVATPDSLGGGGTQTTSLPEANTPNQTSANPENAALWTEFEAGLTKALTRVAPSNLAKKMIADALPKIGLQDGDIPNPGQMSTIGTLATASIPNKSRRMLVEKELSIVLKKLGL